MDSKSMAPRWPPLSAARPGGNMLRVAAYTGGKCVPSARFRVRQYIPALRGLKVDLRDYRAGLGSYPPRMKFLRPLWGAAAVSERIVSAGASYLADVTLL